MNELVYVKNNYNVISACFVKNKQVSSRLYDWYLPHYYLDKVYVNDDVQIKIKGKIKKVRIINLTYHPLAKTMYKPFPIIRNQPSWQGLLCQEFGQINANRLTKKQLLM